MMRRGRPSQEVMQVSEVGVHGAVSGMELQLSSEMHCGDAGMMDHDDESANSASFFIFTAAASLQQSTFISFLAAF